MAGTYFTEKTFQLLRKIHVDPKNEDYKEWIVNLPEPLGLTDELREEVEACDLRDKSQRKKLKRKLFRQHQTKPPGDGKYETYVKDCFEDKLIEEGVWKRLRDEVRSQFEKPSADSFSADFIGDPSGGEPKQKWFALYSKQQKADDPKKSGPRIALVLAPDHLKVAYQSDYRSSREKLKREWNGREDSRRQEIESAIDTVDVGSKRFEYRVGQEANGESEKVDSLQEWVQEQTEGSTGNWSTEIRLMIPKDVVLNTDSDDLEEEIADAIKALFPIYQLAVDMDSADTKGANCSDEEERSHVHQIKELLEKERQVILTGPPGTSKTYTAFQVIHAFSGKESPIQEDRPYQKLANYRFDPADKEEGGERDVVWDIVQFHQSYGYEDFVSGIEASSAQDQDGLKLERVDKVFLSMCEKAKDALDAHDGDAGKAPKYVLIIDEINRGILGRIFGELILGLEYRGLPIRLQGRNGENGEDNEKKDTITIPDNLYLIGTMNTADRNIALVDHALRRRFRFVDMPPNRRLLKKVLDKYVQASEKPLENNQEIVNVFEAVQELFDEDESSPTGAIDRKNYAVGHTYFMCDSMEDFWGNMHYQVLPLLDEYHREGILRSEQLKEFAEYLGTHVDGGDQSNDKSIKKKIAEWCEKWKRDSNDASANKSGADNAPSQEKASQQNGALSQ